MIRPVNMADNDRVAISDVPRIAVQTARINWYSGGCTSLRKTLHCIGGF
jgi:hypothetical protein